MTDALDSTEPGGLPLGGIGTGCVEIDKRGVFRNATTQNNRRAETRTANLPGSFMGIRTHAEGKTSAWILRSEPLRFMSPEEGMPLTWPDQGLSFQGMYPVARLSYRRPECPLGIHLTAFSPVIPQDYRASCLPLVFFVFTIKNDSAEACETSLLFSWENLNGCTGQDKMAGRDNQKRSSFPDMGVEGLLMFPPGGSSGNDFGQYALLSQPPEGWAVTSRQWKLEGGFQEMWGDFKDTGDLRDLPVGEGMGEVGTLCIRGTLGPSQEVTVPIALSWYFPTFLSEGEDWSNRYVGLFTNAQEIALSGLSRWPGYLKRIEDTWRPLFSSSLPDWLQSMLVNSLYVLTTNSIWTRDNRFCMMETPWSPLMAATGQRLYSSIATFLFFPDLEESEMELIAKSAQDGRIHHELGLYKLNAPKTSRTKARWTDLNPKYLLMAIRNARWNGDETSAGKLYEDLKPFMSYAVSQDLDGDGLPDQAGRSTVFDDWAFYGTNPYASSLHLAALKAYSHLARAAGDEAGAADHEELFRRGLQSFESQLWSNDLGYYLLYNDERNPRAQDHSVLNKACQTSQLSGQWMADFLGLGSLFAEDHIRTAVIEILANNGKEHGLAKGLLPGGAPAENPDSEKWRSGSEHACPGCSVSDYSALAIAHDAVEVGLNTVQTIHETLYADQTLTWNQPLTWNLPANAPQGWGKDRYINAPSVWHILYALTGFSIDLMSNTLWLRPVMPREEGEWVSPIYIPGGQGTLGVRKEARRLAVTLYLDPGFTFKKVVLRPPSGWKTVNVKVEGLSETPDQTLQVEDGVCTALYEEGLDVADIGCTFILTRPA